MLLAFMIFHSEGHSNVSYMFQQSNLSERYSCLMDPLSTRQQRLKESTEVQKLFRDVEDEEAWIREKEPIVASNNRGRDLIGVQNLIKKHQAMQAEINNHEPRYDCNAYVDNIVAIGSGSAIFFNLSVHPKSLQGREVES